MDLYVDKISGQNAIPRCFGIYHIIGSISSKMPITLDSKSKGIRSFGIFHNSMESVLWAKSELKKGLEHLDMLPSKLNVANVKESKRHLDRFEKKH